MAGQDNGSARQAVAKLVAELGRAKRAMTRGDLAEARDALAAVRALDPGNLQAEALEEQCRHGATAASPSPSPVSAGLMEQPAWLSFEQRVRERRARRCEQAAEAAILAGSTADALAAIDELALVLPSHPRIVELRERAASPVHGTAASDLVALHDVMTPATLADSLPLQDAWPGVPALAGEDLAAREPSTVPLTHTASTRGGFVALLGALAVLCVAFAGGSWWWVNQQASAPEASQVEPPQDTAHASFEEQAIMPPALQAEPAPTEPTISDDAADRASVEPDASLRPAPAPSASDASVESAPRTPPADPESQPGASVPATVVARAPVAPPQTESPSDRSPTPLATVAAPVATMGNSTTAAAPLSPAGAIQPLNESLPPRQPSPSPSAAAAAATSATAIDPAAHLVADVRQVLDRYAQGYSSKQAALVRQVWPEVDARALERAFGQLDSQDVQFDDCRIEAAETAASATCTGMASWVPAVGDRSPRRQPRTWRFALARQGAGWIITQARVAAK